MSCTSLFGQTANDRAPGAPGLDAHWSSAAKNGFGTANTLTSKVWFTLQNGVMTEVYYPKLDVPNVQSLQLIVVGNKVEAESDDMDHRVDLVDPRAIAFQQLNSPASGDYLIRKTYVSDPQRDTVLIKVEFSSRTPSKLYVYYDPSLNNSGMHDSAWSEDDALLSIDGDKASALLSSSGFGATSSGFLGTSDGLTQLRKHPTGFVPYKRADNGNVVQVAELNFPRGFKNTSFRLTLALSFGKTTREALANARATLAKGFVKTRREYQAGWHEYLDHLTEPEPKYQQQFNFAAMAIKGLEDKTYRGAMIASPSIPWGGGPNANEATTSGYHAVWSRDLYQVATAFLAMGDRASADRALDYLFKVQQKPDGSFPQNSWVDGRPIGNGLQMDQVAFPLLLAYQLGRTDQITWRKHVKPAADFIVKRGPATGQERWEEKPGYSPSTIAAEIAGLVCAGRIATLNNNRNAAELYLQKADEWARNLESWTATSNGKLSKASYFLRITENDNPNDRAGIEINSGGGTYDEREIVDAGFLDLVRLGIRPANDPLIARSLEIIDRLIKVETPGGAAWYRYNHDAYGEKPDGGDYDGRTGVGRLWTLLTGERGEYEVARGDLPAARKHLDAMMSFANEGMMLPEQVWDRNESPRRELRFGAGTGSATPLAWSMAQFIRLAINIKEGHNVETPDLTTSRYLQAQKPLGANKN
ncbi:MAG: glycoside hydrolase family 15 protein [bacterium]